MTALVYDTGALIAADRNDQKMWSRHETALYDSDASILVPTVVVAQAWRDGSRQANLVRFLPGCAPVELTLDLAKTAGVVWPSWHQRHCRCRRGHRFELAKWDEACYPGDFDEYPGVVEL